MGIGFMVVSLLVLLAFVRGGVWVAENNMDLLSMINGWVTTVIVILFVLSIVPRIRLYTGLGIYYGATIWMGIFWLFSLFVTYSFWGFLGVLIGLFFAGIGIYFTAMIAIFQDNQASAALFMLVNLVLMFGIRSLGYWIATKHKEKELPHAASI